jgi:hypothetical protein
MVHTHASEVNVEHINDQSLINAQAPVDSTSLLSKFVLLRTHLHNVASRAAVSTWTPRCSSIQTRLSPLFMSSSSQKKVQDDFRHPRNATYSPALWSPMTSLESSRLQIHMYLHLSSGRPTHASPRPTHTPDHSQRKSKPAGRSRYGDPLMHEMYQAPA